MKILSGNLIQILSQKLLENLKKLGENEKIQVSNPSFHSLLIKLSSQPSLSLPQKYLNPLKQPENSNIVDLQTVDEIFFMVPSILQIHEKFLEELGKRLDAWDPLQRVGDSYYDIVSFAIPKVILNLL